MIERLTLPHALPDIDVALRTVAGPAGPLKPALVNAFAPRGYDCRGETGMFTLRRRTSGNHVVALVVDVGTWSRMVTPLFTVRGPNFEATVPIPVGGRGQYPIGDTTQWEAIVANLSVIVDELDRTFVPEIEAAAGPAPDWFAAD